MKYTYEELLGKEYFMTYEKEYIIDTLFDVDYKMVEAQSKNVELENRIQKALDILEYDIKDNKKVIDILKGEDIAKEQDIDNANLIDRLENILKTLRGEDNVKD